MPLPREPQRRTEAQRRRHLDAHEVALERALLARAGKLDEAAIAYRDAKSEHGETGEFIARFMAGEFRALADELHHWG
jgi:hypothetical protein